MNDKTPLLGMTLAELKEVAKNVGLPAFAGGQIAQWIYIKHVRSIDEMTNISKAGREKLSAQYTIGCMPHLDAPVSYTHLTLPTILLV